MDYLIRVDDLEKRYGDFALQDVSLAVEPGSVVGFVGSNGAGKTTTLKAILGLIVPDGGVIELLGEPVAGPGARARAQVLDAVKARIGVVFDTCAFPATCRVADVGAIGRAAYPTWSRRRFEELCEAFGLAPKKTVKELSRGMGMKLTLAFALAHHPRLLVLDEATAGLDPMARDEVLDILRQFMEQEGHGILMSTHITSDLEKIADKVVCIDEGRIVFDLDKDAISDQAAIGRCRKQDFEAIAASGFFPAGEMRFQSHGFGTDVLVPDRFAFARQFPDVALDRISIEEYMTLVLKGETR